MSRVVTSKGDFSVEAFLVLITMSVPQDWPEARLCFLRLLSLLPEHQRGQATVRTRNPSTEQNAHTCAHTVQWSTNRQNSPDGGKTDEWCQKEISAIFNWTGIWIKTPRLSRICKKFAKKILLPLDMCKDFLELSVGFSTRIEPLGGSLNSSCHFFVNSCRWSVTFTQISVSQSLVQNEHPIAVPKMTHQPSPSRDTTLPSLPDARDRSRWI